MALTPTTAWREAVSRADAQICMLVTITDGASTWEAVSCSMASTSDLAVTSIPVAVQKVTPLGVELDPLERTVEVAGIDIEVDDQWLRPIIVANRLKGQHVDVKIGAAELDRADFLAYATNSMIEEIEPLDNHTVKIVLIGQFKIIMDTNIGPDNHWINKHALECLYDGAGGGILEAAGGHSFNANSFDRTQPEYDDIEHIIIGRANTARQDYPSATTYRWEWSGLNEVRTSGMSLAQEVIRMINGYLVEDEDGDLKVARFDASASAVENWTADDIIPGSFKQETLDSNIINRITFNFGTDDIDQTLRSQYVINDTASQSQYAFPGESERIIGAEIATLWVGLWQRLYASITAGASSLILAGPPCYAVSGNRSGWTVDGTHPVWLMLDSSQVEGINNIEIVKSTSLTRSTTFQGTILVWDGGSWNEEGPFSTHLTFASLSRAQRGTTASAHTLARTTVLDITALVLLGDKLLDRFGDGCPIVEFETGMRQYPVQIGDLVTITWPAYLAYDKDGMTSADKWEVVTKEVDVFANPPVIRWRLAWAAETSPTLAASVFSRATPGAVFDAITTGTDATQFAVISGLGITQKAGLVGTIASGVASNGIRRVTLVEDLDHTFTASKDTYVYLAIGPMAWAQVQFKETALGAGDPGTKADELFLAKVVTDGTDITSVSTTGQETSPLLGARVKDGSLQTATLADLAVTTAKVDSSAVTTAKVAQNAIGTYQKVADVADFVAGSDFNDWSRG